LESSAVVVASAPACRDTARGLVLGALEAFGHLVASDTAIQLAGPALDIRHIELSASDGDELHQVFVVPSAIGECFEG
jgi:hypothetical protein